ncbi:MAG TPA: hypothetical protein DCL40_00485 [Coxiellaceae bacterium]|nr:hypothetical protein [Coxiellaceae bacterium]
MIYQELSAIWRKINRQWGQQVEPVLRDLGLTHTDRMVLMTVSVRPGVSKTEIADSINVQPQSLTRSIERLVQKDLLVKKPHARDERALCFSLTSQAQEKVEMLEANNQRLWQTMLRDFNASEQAQLEKSLGRMLNNLLKANTSTQDRRQE